MRIIRGKSTHVAVLRELIEDCRISFGARGFMVYLIANPNLPVKDATTLAGINGFQVDDLVGELLATGWLVEDENGGVHEL